MFNPDGVVDVKFHWLMTGFGKNGSIKLLEKVYSEITEKQIFSFFKKVFYICPTTTRNLSYGYLFCRWLIVIILLIQYFSCKYNKPYS